MSDPIAPAAIFLPAMVVVALTFVGLLRLIILRTRATRTRAVKLSYYRAFQGDPEPAQVAAAARHYNNLFETPLLFYLGCVVAFLLQDVTTAVLGLAWAYVAARIAQSAIHLTTNNVRQRALAFALGWLFLVALWIVLGAAIVAQV